MLMGLLPLVRLVKDLAVAGEGCGFAGGHFRIAHKEMDANA
jgi:hypothetical protein